MVVEPTNHVFNKIVFRHMLLLVWVYYILYFDICKGLFFSFCFCYGDIRHFHPLISVCGYSVCIASEPFLRIQIIFIRNICWFGFLRIINGFLLINALIEAEVDSEQTIILDLLIVIILEVIHLVAKSIQYM